MFDYKKVLARNVKKHAKKQAKYVESCLKDNWIPNVSKFEFAIPYKPRLGIFKLQRRSLVTFDPRIIEAVSYSHWVFVKVIKGKVVFNDYSYSNTTSRHQWAVKRLLSQLNIKIDVTVNQRESLSNGVMLNPLYHQISKLEIEASRKGARKITQKETPKLIKSVQKEIAALKKLGARIDKPLIGIIKREETDREERRLRDVKAKREQWKLDHRVEIEQKAFHKMVNS